MVYLAVPLGDEDEEPTEADAETIGALLLSTVQRETPLNDVTLVGTRLTRNPLAAPGVMKRPHA